MEGGTDIADIARPLADAMFNRWGRNVTAYSLMDGKIVGEVRRLAARFVFDLFLGKNQVDIEDVVAWQEEYEYYSRTLGSLPIPLEGTPYAAACSRFRRIADAVRNAKWFQRRLFSLTLTHTLTLTLTQMVSTEALQPRAHRHRARASDRSLKAVCCHSGEPRLPPPLRAVGEQHRHDFEAQASPIWVMFKVRVRIRISKHKRIDAGPI